MGEKLELSVRISLGNIAYYLSIALLSSLFLKVGDCKKPKFISVYNAFK